MDEESFLTTATFGASIFAYMLYHKMRMERGEQGLPFAQRMWEWFDSIFMTTLAPNVNEPIPPIDNEPIPPIDNEPIPPIDNEPIPPVLNEAAPTNNQKEAVGALVALGQSIKKPDMRHIKKVQEFLQKKTG